MAVAQDRPGAGSVEIEEQASRGLVGTIVNLSAAAVSLGLIVGVGLWSYDLIMRDVTGIPVVRALEGPMRVQPENPGGQQAAHQGLAVNMVAARGTAEDPADRLVLAPRPVELASEDAPMAQLLPATLAEATDQQEPVIQQVEEVPPTAIDEEVIAAFEAGSVDALVDALAADAGPLEAPLPTEAAFKPAVAAQIDALVTAAMLSGPGLPASLRPQARPAESARQPVALSRAAAPGQIDPADIPVGTALAQLGAFESREVAGEEWDRLQTDFGDYLRDKSRVIEQAASAGRTFFRLRAMGFDDLSEARRFCAALVAESADCIPVLTR